jgi:alpha-1,2-mannosyltransferase
MLSKRKLDIAVAHLSLNFFGGEEKLCLSVIEALKLSNHRVTLFTVEKTDWASASRFFDCAMRPDAQVYPKSSMIRSGLTKTSALVFAYVKYLEGLISLRGKYDLIINTYGDLVNSIADVSYVHFPIKATLDYSQIPVFMSPIKWTAYCQVYNLAALFVDRISPSLLLTNSKFTQQIVKKYLKRESSVLHPAVDVKSYAKTKVKSENLVVTVSKFTTKRCLHRVPQIARNTKNARFIIIGGADKYSAETIVTLQKAIREQGVQDRVILMPNVQRSRLIELLASAKVYLHVMPSEHFGISIIEAMAAGCVPIVHRSGGPWLDILDQKQGKYGFSYETPEEAAYIIENILNDERLGTEVSRAAQKRSFEYDESSFRRSLQVLVTRLTSRDS